MFISKHIFIFFRPFIYVFICSTSINKQANTQFKKRYNIIAPNKQQQLDLQRNNTDINLLL